MKWFAVYLAATSLWGNGNLEERSPSPAAFFYGTSEECRSYANVIHRSARSREESRTEPHRTGPHLHQPRVYTGGVREINYYGAACIGFDSAEQMIATLPGSAELLSWMRPTGDGYSRCRARVHVEEWALRRSSFPNAGIVLCETGQLLSELIEAEGNVGR